MTEMSLIHEKICEYFNEDYLFPFQRVRKRKNIYLRQLFHYISRKRNPAYLVTSQAIGDYLGDITKPFDHATVLHSCKKIEGYLEHDKNIKKDVEEIVKMLDKNE